LCLANLQVSQVKADADKQVAQLTSSLKQAQSQAAGISRERERLAAQVQQQAATPQGAPEVSPSLKAGHCLAAALAFKGQTGCTNVCTCPGADQHVAMLACPSRSSLLSCHICLCIHWLLGACMVQHSQALA